MGHFANNCPNRDKNNNKRATYNNQRADNFQEDRGEDN